MSIKIIDSVVLMNIHNITKYIFTFICILNPIKQSQKTLTLFEERCNQMKILSPLNGTTSPKNLSRV